MPVNTLSPYQLAIQGVVGKGKGAAQNITAEMLGRIADSVFGSAPVTPGSHVTYQDATTVRWTDPQGYEHVATRDLNGQNPAAGQWRDTTSRPNVLPNQAQQSLAQALGQQVQQNFTTPLQFAPLDPDTQARLQAINAAEQSRLAQQYQQQGGDLLASLYGRNVQQSSIANEGVARLAQLQALVSQQQQADAANRELATRQYLTGIGQQRNEALAGLYSNLSGQQNQANIANAGYNVDIQRLLEQARQANQGFQLGQEQTNLAISQARSPWNKLLQGISAAGSLAGGIGTGISAATSLYNRLTQGQQGQQGGYTAYNTGGISSAPGF